MSHLMQDLRYALRQLRKTPGFTLVAALTLAIGIGSATAVFTLVETVLLRPLPFAQPQRVVALDPLRDTGSGARIPSDVSYSNFFDWRSRAKSFSAITAYRNQAFTFGSAGEPARRLAGMAVTAEFFEVAGVSPVIGRGFTRDEERAGNRSVILSQSLWRTAFHKEVDVLGKAIQLNEESYVVVGVLPAGFVFPGSVESEVWVTSAGAMEGKNPSGTQRGWNQLDAMGRLAPGVSVEQARAEMQLIQGSLATEYPQFNRFETTVRVVPELEEVVGDVARPLHVLFGAVCFLLLIACANVAGLLLARTNGRRSELAVRAALGATRIQIVRQLLMEACTLALLGGAGGLALAAGALRLAPRFLPANLPRIDGLSMDAGVLVFALLVSLLTSLLFGAFPAWRMSRLDPALALRDSSRGNTASRGQQRLHALLVVGETALGLILLVGAGLLMRSFVKMLHVEPGFETDHLLSFRIGMPDRRFDVPHILQFAQQLQARMASVPGVQQATYGFPMPYTGGNMSITFNIEGQPVAVGAEPSARASTVAPNFFQTMRIPLLHGRFFSSVEEQPASAPTVIVNQAFADRYFPHEAALGKRIKSGLSNQDPAPFSEIVGVVGNVSHVSVTEQAQPEYYVPFAQSTVGAPPFALRVAGDPVNYIDTVRSVVAQQDAALPVFNTRPFSELLTRSSAQQRFQTILLGAFAGIALLLSAIGLYAVLSFTVAQRRMELGLRMALGANRGDVLRLVMGGGLRMTTAGLLLGLIASALLTRFLATLLFATKSLDPVTFGVMTVVLLGTSVVACVVPAYRASRMDPNETLREQ